MYVKCAVYTVIHCFVDTYQFIEIAFAKILLSEYSYVKSLTGSGRYVNVLKDSTTKSSAATPVLDPFMGMQPMAGNFFTPGAPAPEAEEPAETASEAQEEPSNTGPSQPTPASQQTTPFFNPSSMQQGPPTSRSRRGRLRR